MPTVSNQVKLAGLYAAFDRAPDADGFNHWMGVIDSSTNPGPAIASAFLNTPTFRSEYGNLENQAFVETIYQNVLGGNGDQAGIEFWTQQLEGGMSRGEFVANFVNSALTADLGESGLSGAELEAAQARQDYITNRAEVGLDYVETLGDATNVPTNSAGNPIISSPAYQAALAIIEDVDSSQASVDAATQLINNAASAANPTQFINNGGASAASTLTISEDSITGTSGNDLFDAPTQVSGGNSVQTLQDVDTINGGGGTDRLNATLIDDTAPTLNSVENLYLRSVTNASTLDASNVTGAQQIWNTRSGSDLTVTNLQNAVTLGLNAVGTGSVTTIGYAGLSSNNITQNVVLQGAGSAGTAATINVTNGGSGTINGLTLNAASGTNNIALGAGLDNVTTLTVNGSAALTVTANDSFADLTSLAAGNYSGGLTLDLSSATTLTSATTGSGNDSLTLNGTALETVNTGAGNDTVIINNTDIDTGATVALGAGNDVLNISAATDLANNSNLTLQGGAGNDRLTMTSAQIDNFSATGSQNSISGFEVLGIDGLAGTVSTTAVANLGFTSLYLSSATGGTVNDLDANSNVTLQGGATNLTLNVTGATAQGSNSDAFGFTVVDGGSYGVTVAGVETLNVTTQNSDNEFGLATLNITDDELQNLNLSGSEAVSFTAAGTQTALDSVDASGITAQSDTSAETPEFAATINVAAQGVRGVEVTGSSQADSITLGQLTTAAGGSGNDLFAVTSTGADSYSTITDFSAGDRLQFSGQAQALAQGEDAFGSAISLAGTATFSDYLNAAAAGDGSAEGSDNLAWFQFQGDTFAVYDAGASASYADGDAVVRLTGTVDLSQANVTADGITIA